MLYQGNLLSKTLVIGVVVLFVGVSLSSAVSINAKSAMDHEQSEECRECNEVSDADLIKVERLLERVEIYSKLLMVLSKNNPEIKENYENLADMISILNTLNSKESICNWLEDKWYDIMFNIGPYYAGLWYVYFYYKHKFILSFIPFSIAMMYVSLTWLIWIIYDIIGCFDIPQKIEFDFRPALKSYNIGGLI